MKSVTIKDIARLAEVAPSTVSAVLNGKAKQARISDPVAAKVQQIATELGYQPNHTAVSLRTGKSKIIGLIVEDISNTFFASLAKKVEEEMYAHGYKIVYCSTENNDERGCEQIRMLNNRQVDGFIITPSNGMEEEIRRLQEQEKPIVFLDRYIAGMNVASSLVDNSAGITAGMEHLLEKGYRKIAFVTVGQSQVQMQLREKAYRAAIDKAGLAPVILTLTYDITMHSVVEGITAFLQTAEIDAVFFATNYLGIAGIESIKQCGLSIPNDIAVICFDDNDIFRLYAPGITALEQPIHDIVKEAVHLLMEQFLVNGHAIQEKKMPQLFAPKLLVRGST